MKVSDVLNLIKSSDDYYPNSLVLKSKDEYGCSYKWLIKSYNCATRKQVFIELDIEESGLDLEDKTAVSYIEVYPAI